MKWRAKRVRRCSRAERAWLILGGVVSVGALFMVLREIPSMRRELRIMRM
jgi:hypothetical protein